MNKDGYEIYYLCESQNIIIGGHKYSKKDIEPYKSIPLKYNSNKVINDSNSIMNHTLSCAVLASTGVYIKF